MTRVVAIIPARGGSKRIPKKNIVPFNGKPLIAHTIEAAKASGVFDDIIVSTDSEEIATVSKKYGALVPELRDEKSDDISPVSEATIHTLKQLERKGLKYDVVIQLFAVCPLRDAADIEACYQYFRERKAPFVLSCFKFDWMNPWWAFSKNQNGEAKWLFDDARKQRSQDLPDLYSPTGAIWIANVDALLKEGSFYGKGHIFWEMDWKHALDIDVAADLEMAGKFV